MELFPVPPGPVITLARASQKLERHLICSSVGSKLVRTLLIRSRHTGSGAISSSGCRKSCTNCRMPSSASRYSLVDTLSPSYMCTPPKDDPATSCAIAASLSFFALTSPNLANVCPPLWRSSQTSTSASSCKRSPLECVHHLFGNARLSTISKSVLLSFRSHRSRSSLQGSTASWCSQMRNFFSHPDCFCSFCSCQGRSTVAAFRNFEMALFLCLSAPSHFFIVSTHSSMLRITAFGIALIVSPVASASSWHQPCSSAASLCCGPSGGGAVLLTLRAFSACSSRRPRYACW